MSEPQTPLSDEPSVSWRKQAVRRGAGTLGAAIILAGVGPAIANAAGADVKNPVAVALRASGKGLAKAFGTETDACATPTPEPTDAGASPSPEGSPAPTPDPNASTEPSSAPSELPSPDPVADDCEEDATETPAPTPSESPSESPAEEPAEEAAEEGEHGQIVSTVARCAPKGKDPLLDVEGAPANHGGYVKVAAHGDTLALPWGSYDLSTLAGAEDLCASLAAARADLDATDGPAKAKKDKVKRAKPHQAKSGKGRNR